MSICTRVNPKYVVVVPSPQDSQYRKEEKNRGCRSPRDDYRRVVVVVTVVVVVLVEGVSRSQSR